MAGEKEKTVEGKAVRNKGGRQKKAIARSQHLAVKCSLTERVVIASNARNTGRKVSEFLRELGLKTRIEVLQKALPKEVLALTGTLNHLAANLNQIARKRNGLDELSPLERAELKIFSVKLRTLVQTIKKYFT